MRVAILHDAPSLNARPDELDTFEQVECVERALSQLGHATTRLAFSLDLSHCANALREVAPDVVFNLVESVGGAARLLHLAPALLDELGLPYTGASTEATFLTTQKLIAKRLLRAHGLPTPAWATLADFSQPPLGRVILKSVWEHASIDLDDSALADAADAAALHGLLRERTRRIGRELFSESYVEGREFNLALLGLHGAPQALAPAEIEFVDFPPDKPRIVNYAAKWATDSFEYSHTPRSFNTAQGDHALLERLRELAERCWRLFGVRGYARVDFRVDVAGQPWILEINTNPCLAPDAGFPAAAAQAGIDFQALVARLVAEAMV